jgi:hypothetical protein
VYIFLNREVRAYISIRERTRTNTPGSWRSQHDIYMPKPEKLLLCLFLTDQMISFSLGGGGGGPSQQNKPCLKNGIAFSEGLPSCVFLLRVVGLEKGGSKYVFEIYAIVDILHVWSLIDSLEAPCTR